MCLACFRITLRNLHCFANDSNITEEELEIDATLQHSRLCDEDELIMQESRDPTSNTSTSTAPNPQQVQDEDEDEGQQEEGENDDWVVYSSRKVPIDCRRSKTPVNEADTDDIDTLTMLYGLIFIKRLLY